MKAWLAGILSGLCATGLAAEASLSDLICDDTTRLQQQLGDIGGAELHGQGLRDPEAMLEIWIVPDTGDWTLVQNYANGTSCILAFGEHWHERAPASPA